jgi:hypothetical protein
MGAAMGLPLLLLLLLLAGAAAAAGAAATDLHSSAHSCGRGCQDPLPNHALCPTLAYHRMGLMELPPHGQVV